MDLKQARKRIGFWRRELNLEDWTIRTRLAREGEIPDKYATCEVFTQHGVACIVIHKDSEYPEFWLLHEILHIVLSGLVTVEGESLVEERAINRVTRALCRAHQIEYPKKTELADKD